MPATPTEALLDVNLLIAAVFADHPHHIRCRDFVLGLQRFHTTPTTQGGFLRFATRPWRDTGSRQFPPRQSISAGMATLQQLTSSSRHVFAPDDVQFEELDLSGLTGHRQWTDAYLLHIARAHGVTLATMDSAIASIASAAGSVYVLT